MAASLDGNNDVITATGYKGILGANPRTITARIKIVGSGGANGDTILAWGTNVAGKRYVFYVSDDDGGKLKVTLRVREAVGTAVVADGNWHDVALVFPVGGTGVQHHLFYVDGVSDAMSGSVTGAVNTGSGADVKLAEGIVVGKEFSGLMSDVRLYSTALTAEEIKEIHAAQGLDMIMRILPYLELRYPLRGQKDVVLGTVKDFSRNGRSGVRTSAPVYKEDFTRLARP